MNEFGIVLDEELIEVNKKLQQENKILKENYKSIDKSMAELMEENQQLKEELEKIKQPTIFIDTGDMEERWGEQLYQDYLEKQNKDLKDRIDKAIEEFEFEIKSLKEKKRLIMALITPENGYLKADIEFEIKRIEDYLKMLKGSDNND